MDTEQIPPEKLRDLYINANLSQRYRVALDRIQNPEVGPNVLVNVVAALEGFARAVALRAAVAKGKPKEDAYRRLWKKTPEPLIVDHICPAYETTPDELFDQDEWKHLPEAITFRNLLAHEATFLDGGRCNILIAAVLHNFDRLAERTGVKKA